MTKQKSKLVAHAQVYRERELQTSILGKVHQAQHSVHCAATIICCVKLAAWLSLYFGADFAVLRRLPLGELHDAPRTCVDPQALDDVVLPEHQLHRHHLAQVPAERIVLCHHMAQQHARQGPRCDQRRGLQNTQGRAVTSSPTSSPTDTNDHFADAFQFITLQVDLGESRRCAAAQVAPRCHWP